MSYGVALAGIVLASMLGIIAPGPGVLLVRRAAAGGRAASGWPPGSGWRWPPRCVRRRPSAWRW